MGKIYFLLCSTLAVAAWAYPKSELQLPVGQVQMSVTDSFGQPIEKASIAINSTDGHLGRSVSPNQRIELPYGEYTIRVSAEGAVTSTRSIEIVAPETWIQTGLNVQFGDTLWKGGSLTIKGVLKAHRRASWAKLSGIYVPSDRETFIDKAGRFTFSGLFGGAYTISLFDGRRLLSTRFIEIDERRRVTTVFFP